MGKEKFKRLIARLEDSDTELHGVEDEVEELLIQTIDLLSDSRLVLGHDFWKQNQGNLNISKEIVTELLGVSAPELDNKYKDNLSFHHYFWKLNQEYQRDDRTTGAASYFEQVSELQNGTFCVLCGVDTELEVDHIQPVSRSGDPADPKNMQLLCRKCNSAKSSIPNRFLPDIVRVCNEGAVSERSRIKLLIDNSRIEQGRTFGVCACGTTSRGAKLKVVTKNRKLAANYLNLKTVCTKCENTIC